MIRMLQDLKECLESQALMQLSAEPASEKYRMQSPAMSLKNQLCNSLRTEQLEVTDLTLDSVFNLSGSHFHVV